MMHTIPLRRLVSVIGLSVAITVAVGMPIGYFIDGHYDIGNNLTFKGKLNAARVAQYIYSHDTMWQYQRLRLAELIQMPEADEEPINQKIYDEGGRLVVDDGVSLPAPIAARRVPIVVSGASVGTLVVETSMANLVRKTWLVGLLSTALGFAIYFALRIFPLRVLGPVFS